MADIRHRVGITAPREQVYQALATTEGLSRWWTRDTAGDPAVGGKLEFYFGQAEPGGVMEVTELDPGQRVAWRCVQGPDEWVDTVVTFDLSRAGDGQAGDAPAGHEQAGTPRPAPSQAARPCCCSPTRAGVTRPSSCTTAAPSGRTFC